MLILLRLNIGWHFFCEGLSHTDPTWTSEGFLRSATGPLAPKVRAILPDYYGFHEMWVKGTVEEGKTWFESFGNHLSTVGRSYADFYEFDDEQKKHAAEFLRLRQLELSEWIKNSEEEIEKQFYERDRLANNAALSSAATVPYQAGRVGSKQSELNAAISTWLGKMRAIEGDFRKDLEVIRNEEQVAKGPLLDNPTLLKRIDGVMAYGILTIGFCLILGLFTRTACVLGVLFLASVVLTQPFWVSDAQPTFNQWVEMFALATLATTQVGKWGGLDFFLSCLFGGCCRASRTAAPDVAKA
jgi:uncharacterized membrane protein YphA (DoxX/SURF4 family)